MAMDGVEIITNGSGSYHQLRKLDTRVKLATGATFKVSTPLLLPLLLPLILQEPTREQYTCMKWF
jgi:hypothetical protein